MPVVGRNALGGISHMSNAVVGGVHRQRHHLGASVAGFVLTCPCDMEL